MNEHGWMNDREAADFLGVSVGLLRKWRFYANGGPAYYHVGRSVRYSRADLTKFLDSARVEPQDKRAARRAA
jgi:hypothetical protein